MKNPSENKSEISKLQKILKPMSLWHLIIGIVVVILGVVLAQMVLVQIIL